MIVVIVTTSMTVAILTIVSILTTVTIVPCSSTMMPMLSKCDDIVNIGDNGDLGQGAFRNKSSPDWHSRPIVPLKSLYQIEEHSYLEGLCKYTLKGQ